MDNLRKPANEVDERRIRRSLTRRIVFDCSYSTFAVPASYRKADNILRRTQGDNNIE